MLEVEELETSFITELGDYAYLDRISFHVDPGEIVCLVGESGSGKSITSLSIMGLLSSNGRVSHGRICFDGCDLLALSERELDKIRGNTLTMIFQDALTSLNPLLTIGDQLTEVMHAHLSINRREARQRAIQLLERVGMPDPASVLRQYPFTLSGGMRQRVMIAMALACNPKLLIADEPTTALDVTIQAQIMRLLLELRSEFGMSILLITHDMGLVAQMADRVLVMYAGQIVEEATAEALFSHPSHPYTHALLASVPSIHDEESRLLTAIPGTVPEQYQTLNGCRFFSRCPYRIRSCERRRQKWHALTPDHSIRCQQVPCEGCIEEAVLAARRATERRKAAHARMRGCE